MAGVFDSASGFPVAVNVEGAETLAAYLQEIGFDLAGKRMRTALKRGADPIKKAAIAKAPRSPHGRGPNSKYPHEPGNLKSEIEIKAARIKNRDYVVVHVGVTRDAYYWRWVEFGKHIKHKQDAKPFLRPAAEEQKDNALRKVTKSLRTSMKRYRTKQTKGMR